MVRRSCWRLLALTLVGEHEILTVTDCGATTVRPTSFFLTRDLRDIASTLLDRRCRHPKGEETLVDPENLASSSSGWVASNHTVYVPLAKSSFIL